MLHPTLDLGEDFAGVAFEPVAVKGFGHEPELDDEVAGEGFGPLEANPPLVIDADAVLALPVALQGFEPVTRHSGSLSWSPHAGCPRTRANRISSGRVDWS